MNTINTFTYKGELFVRLIPSKMLFRSSMVHEVVNRGDIFAMRVRDQQFTVIPGKAEVEHTKHTIEEEKSKSSVLFQAMSKSTQPSLI